MKKYLIILYIGLVLVTLIILTNISLDKFKDDKDLRYKSISKELQMKTKTLIEQKKEATLLIGLTLAKDNLVKKALIQNDHTILSLDSLSKEFRKSTGFNYVWFHMVTSKGVSFLKSWTPKRGENILNIRKDIRKILKNPKVSSVISVGKYDMTIKASIPVYEDKKFLGIIEVVTKLNSIADSLTQDGVSPVILADKSYKKQLKFPFSKKFIHDYYLVNIGADSKLIALLEKEKIYDLVKEDYRIINGYLMSVYKHLNVDGTQMAYFLLFKDISSINITDLKEKHTNFVLVWVVFLAILLTVLFVLLYTSYASLLKREVEKKTKELNEINQNLTKKVEEETKKNIDNEKKLFQQSKIIDMNDLLNNIAHHWRQPLSIISTSASGVKLQIQHNIGDKEEMLERMDSIIQSSQLLSNTINYFSSALRDDSQLLKFRLDEFTNKIHTIIEGVLKENNINMHIEHEDKDIVLLTYETKLINVILSLITNAKDIFIERDISDKQIIFSTYKRDDFIYIDIIDNGGGVDEEIIDKIFEPYVTTFHKSLNKGLSLYLSYETVKEYLKGELSVTNTAHGAKFTVKLPLS